MAVIMLAPSMVIAITRLIGVPAAVWSAVIAVMIARRANPDAYSARSSIHVDLRKPSAPSYPMVLEAIRDRIAHGR
jgi:hypothetical protein